MPPKAFNPGFGPLGFFTAMKDPMLKLADKQARKTNNPNAQAVGKRSARKAAKRKEAKTQQEMMLPLYEAMGSLLEPATARRKTASGQFERPEDVRDLAWLEKNGPDRDRVALRQKSLQAQGLSRPGVMEQAKADVELAKKNQEAWQTLFPKAPTQNQDEYLRTPTPGVDVVFDPKYNQVNPRTGLVTNTGPFTRTIDSRLPGAGPKEGAYGYGSAMFGGMPQQQKQNAASSAAPKSNKEAPFTFMQKGFVGPPNLGEPTGPNPPSFGQNLMTRLRALRSDIAPMLGMGVTMTPPSAGLQPENVFDTLGRMLNPRDEAPASNMPPPNNWKPTADDPFGQRDQTQQFRQPLGPNALQPLQPLPFDFPPSPPRQPATFPTQVSAQPQPSTVQAPNLQSIQEMFGLAPPPPSQFNQAQGNQFMYGLPQDSNIMRLPISITAPNLTQAQEQLATPAFNFDTWLSNLTEY